MKKILFFNILTSSILFAVASAAVADTLTDDKTLYVQSTRAKLLESPNFKSRVVISADKGADVQVVQQKGNWFQVKFHGQVGWVSRLVVSDAPPINKHSVLKGKSGEAQHKARRRASNTATAAATRGLRDDNRTRASDKALSNFNALKQVESSQADKEAVQQFNRQKQSEQQQ